MARLLDELRAAPRIPRVVPAESSTRVPTFGDAVDDWLTYLTPGAVNAWEITKVKEYAGHRDIKTTMRYVHHKTKAAEADAGGTYLESLPGGANNHLPLASVE